MCPRLYLRCRPHFLSLLPALPTSVLSRIGLRCWPQSFSSLLRCRLPCFLASICAVGHDLSHHYLRCRLTFCHSSIAAADHNLSHHCLRCGPPCFHTSIRSASHGLSHHYLRCRPHVSSPLCALPAPLSHIIICDAGLHVFAPLFALPAPLFRIINCAAGLYLRCRPHFSRCHLRCQPLCFQTYICPAGFHVFAYLFELLATLLRIIICVAGFHASIRASGHNFSHHCLRCRPPRFSVSIRAAGHTLSHHYLSFKPLQLHVLPPDDHCCAFALFCQPLPLHVFCDGIAALASFFLRRITADTFLLYDGHLHLQVLRRYMPAVNATLFFLCPLVAAKHVPSSFGTGQAAAAGWPLVPMPCNLQPRDTTLADVYTLLSSAGAAVDCKNLVSTPPTHHAATLYRAPVTRHALHPIAEVT